MFQTSSSAIVSVTLKILQDNSNIYLYIYVINCIGKEKIKHCTNRAVSKGSGGPLSSGVLKTEQLRFLFYRLIVQACVIKYLVACRLTLACSFPLFRVPAPGLHMIKNIAVMHRLHHFVTFEYGLAPGAGTLNKRNELASVRRHATKYLIKHA